MTTPASSCYQEQLLDDEDVGLSSDSEGCELAARVDQALQSRGYMYLRRVAVSVDKGIVVLRGCVPSYYLKLLAQETAMRIPGVRGLANELNVT